MHCQQSRFLSVTLVLSLLGAATGCVDGYPPDGTDPETGEAISEITTVEGFEAGT